MRQVLILFFHISTVCPGLRFLGRLEASSLAEIEQFFMLNNAFGSSLAVKIYMKYSFFLCASSSGSCKLTASSGFASSVLYESPCLSCRQRRIKNRKITNPRKQLTPEF